MSRSSVPSAIVLSLAISMSACAHTPTPETAAVPSQALTEPASPSHCDASKASAALGQRPLAGVLEAARRAAGAEVVRTLHQGQPITKEFRVGRLNLVLDAEGRIASANCS